MKGLTLHQQEQQRRPVLHRLVAGVVAVREASEVLGLSQRPGWRRWAT